MIKIKSVLTSIFINLISFGLFLIGADIFDAKLDASSGTALVTFGMAGLGILFIIESVIYVSGKR